MYKIKATYLPRGRMKFDLDYYFRVHVPLAEANRDSTLRIAKIEVETNAELLLTPGKKSTPCVFSVYVETREDVDRFREFMQSDGVTPMREVGTTTYAANCPVRRTPPRPPGGGVGNQPWICAN